VLLKKKFYRASVADCLIKFYTRDFLLGKKERNLYPLAFDPIG